MYNSDTARDLMLLITSKILQDNPVMGIPDLNITDGEKNIRYGSNTDKNTIWSMKSFPGRNLCELVQRTNEKAKSVKVSYVILASQDNGKR